MAITLRGRGFPVIIKATDSLIRLSFDDANVLGSAGLIAVSNTPILSCGVMSASTFTFAATAFSADHFKCTDISAATFSATNALFSVASATNVCATNLHAGEICATTFSAVGSGQNVSGATSFTFSTGGSSVTASTITAQSWLQVKHAANTRYIPCFTVAQVTLS